MTDCKPRRVEAVVYETLDGRLDARLDYRRDDRDDIDYASKRLTEAGFRPGDRVVIVDVAWLADVERELALRQPVVQREILRAPEEHARAVVAAWEPSRPEHLLILIAATIRAAVEEEREACAQAVERRGGTSFHLAGLVAAIRSRGGTQ